MWTLKDMRSLRYSPEASYRTRDHSCHNGLDAGSGCLRTSKCVIPNHLQPLKACNCPAHLLISFTGRQVDDGDSDGAPFPKNACHRQRLHYHRTCGGRTKRNIHIMGAVHLDHATHYCALHELHAPAEKDTSCPRDRNFHLCRYWSLSDYETHSDLTIYQAWWLGLL